MAKRINAAWMWMNGDQVCGLRLDLADGTLKWYDEAGCHCTDEDYYLQTVQEFQQAGVPVFVGPLPEDVAAEVEETLAGDSSKR
jgi:hypothetical protein